MDTDVNKKYKKEILALYFIQISNLIFPFILLIYIANKVGIEGLGKIAFYQILCMLITFVVDFGFSLSASRLLALNINNAKEKNIIYTNVQFSRIIIWIIYCLISIVGVNLIQLSQLDLKIFYSSIVSGLFSIIMGAWIYQAYTENSILAFLTLMSKIFSTIIILIVVKNYDDLIKVIYIQLIFSALLGGAAWYYLKIKYNIKIFYKYLSLNKMLEYSKESYHNFIASFFTLGFTYLNPFLVKYFFGDLGLGLYSIAEKITNVLKQSFFPIAQTFYADNCKLAMEKKYKNIIEKNKKIFYFFSFLCLLAGLLNIFFGHLVYSYLFKESNGIVEMVTVMIFTQWVISIAIILVNLMIIPLGQSAILKKVYLVGLGFYLIIIFPMLNEWGLNGILYSILFTEIFLTIVFFIFIFNHLKIKN